MPIVSIVLFVFAAALLIYAGMTALTKKIVVPINRSASVKNATKAYAVKMAKLIAFMAIAPAVGGIFGLFIDIIAVPVIIFIVLFIALLVIGNKIIIER